ncbi:vWA domain-containing protein [Vibrio gangliei]|uniref:vWA domain-containing protein n=1 Tax=Vibrio gangliei TaxID=2077090 RepID=UPI002231821B|nr:VWA domain-containing protein [Vibrio gangliei]
MSILKSLPVFIGGLMNEFQGMRLLVTANQGDAYCQKSGGCVRINIPPFDPSDETLKCAAYAYSIHEAGHARYTDSKEYSKAAKKFGQLAGFLNIFEDCFIEKKLSLDFAGAKAKLIWLRKYLIDDNTLDNASQLSNSSLLHNYIYCRSFGYSGYFSVYERSIGIYADCLIKRGFEKAKLEKLNEILFDVRLIDETIGSIMLTDRLISFFKDQEDDSCIDEKADGDTDGKADGDTDGNADGDTDGNADGDTDGNADGDTDGNADGDTDGNADGDTDGKADGDTDGNADGDTDGKADGDTDGKADGDTDGKADGDTDGKAGGDTDGDKAKPFDLSNAVNGFENNGELDAGKVLKDLLSQGVDNFETISLPVMPQLVSIQNYPVVSQAADIMNDANKLSSSLRRSLHGLVQAKYAKKVGTGRKGKRLTQNAIEKLTRFDHKVFRTTTEVECESTHFHILIDSSGSMAGTRITQTIASTMAILDSLKVFHHVKTSVYGFGFENTYDVAVLKTPQQTQSICLNNLTRLCTRGCTPLAQALMATLVQAQSSGDNRNVIILLTDGLPDEEKMTTEMIRQIHKEPNIEMYSLMIDSAPAKGKEIFGDNFTVVKTLTDLPKAIFEIAKKSA